MPRARRNPCRACWRWDTDPAPPPSRRSGPRVPCSLRAAPLSRRSAVVHLSRRQTCRRTGATPALHSGTAGTDRV
jgi:hypothetical protein